MSAPVLDIAVVGAGIAGLATALCLHKTGQKVTVYEKKPGTQYIGGPLSVMPNGVRALRQFGLANTLEDKVRKYDLPWRWRRNWSFSRAELQKILWEQTKTMGVLVYFDARISSIVESEPAILFEDGRKVKADVIVGADEVTFWMGPPRSITCSHILHDGQKYHMTMKVPYKLGQQEVWELNGQVSEAKKYFSDFHSSISKRLSLVEDNDCHIWRISQLNPLETWLSPSGKVLILGDAAHAMVPNAAQGAIMCIEDAAALAVCLSSKGIGSKADVPGVLRVFEALRKPRCEFVVARAAHRERLYHFSDGPEQKARDERMKSWGKMYGTDRRVWDGKHIDEPPALVSPLSNIYLMGYDVVDHTIRTLEREKEVRAVL